MKNYYTWPLSCKCEAITTTTELGNMAFQIGNNHGEVEANRDTLYKELGILSENVIYVHQSHSDVIKEVTIEDKGRGEHSFEDGIEADALYTKCVGLGLGVFHADCQPIFFIDETVPLIGIIHAGFKGTLKHITYKVLKQVIEAEKLDPNNIKLFFGPSRREKSFEVDKASIREIRLARFTKCVANKHFNMALANKLEAIKAGIPASNIQDSLLDTVTEELCYSAYEKTPVGRMASIITLKY